MVKCFFFFFYGVDVSDGSLGGAGSTHIEMRTAQPYPRHNRHTNKNDHYHVVLYFISLSDIVFFLHKWLLSILHVF